MKKSQELRDQMNAFDMETSEIMKAQKVEAASQKAYESSHPLIIAHKAILKERSDKRWDIFYAIRAAEEAEESAKSEEQKKEEREASMRLQERLEEEQRVSYLKSFPDRGHRSANEGPCREDDEDGLSIN